MQQTSGEWREGRGYGADVVFLISQSEEAHVVVPEAYIQTEAFGLVVAALSCDVDGVKGVG